MNARKVSWDDVEHFCQHTQFLEPLCGPRCSPNDVRAMNERAEEIEAYSLLFSSSFDEFPEFIMSIIGQVARFSRERILTWNVVTSDTGNDTFFIRVTVYLK